MASHCARAVEAVTVADILAVLDIVVERAMDQLKRLGAVIRENPRGLLGEVAPVAPEVNRTPRIVIIGMTLSHYGASCAGQHRFGELCQNDIPHRLLNLGGDALARDIP